MKIRMLAGIGGAIVVVLLVVVAIVVATIDVNQYRGAIAEKASALTGRKLTLAGPIKLTLGFSPAIVLEDVRFANARWGSRPDMVRFKRLEAQVKLFPLIFGGIQVKRLILVEPDIFLETNRSGQGNWVLDLGGEKRTKAAPTASGGPAIPLIAEFRLRGGKLTFLDGISGKRQTIVLNAVEARAEGFDAPLNFKFNGSLNKVSFEGKGLLGPLSRWSFPAGPRA
jgi:uncharacterized protein involved in outer membrane biogenesis